MTETAERSPPSLDRWLPGDPPPAQQIKRMIRVDQAGEVGAVRIYEGQLRILGKSKSAAEIIRHMHEQEAAHRERFDALLVERRVRPTLLSPIWNAAGFALGAATALMGPRAAMACTVAIEEVIDEHYAAQAEALGDHEPALKETLESFRADEIHHRDVALEHGAESIPNYATLTAAIKFGSKLAIWLSSRL